MGCTSVQGEWEMENSQWEEQVLALTFFQRKNND